MARLLVHRFRTEGAAPQPENNLSEREQQILKLLSTGQRAKEVSDQIEVSVHTVRARRAQHLPQTPRAFRAGSGGEVHPSAELT